MIKPNTITFIYNISYASLNLNNNNKILYNFEFAIEYADQFYHIG